MPKKASTKKAEKFEAIVNVMGKNYTGKGETVYEALGNVKLGLTAGKIIITVKHDKNVKEKVVNTGTANLAFNTLGMTRDINLKRLATLFDNV